jgi:pseudouridine-5'-phosphate glycosidase
MFDRSLLRMNEEVEAALDAGGAVVALESTVVAHGLPRPLNLETARRLEEIVRDGGAVPATVAILAGRLCVGLDDAELRHIAESKAVHKISRRDLPVAVARRLDGATTVATTMWIAHRAGLEVFATGGIGGVHRGALPDISADLPGLASTPMVVVCSGAKIVLDLPATREWLETHGVTVAGFGCEELPAFYLRRSGLGVDVRVETASEAAELARARRRLGMESALVLAVPVPSESEVEESVAQDALADALIEAERAGIKGRELTPFLLSRMAERSEGATLRANVALLENNARVAAEVALALREEQK